MRAWQRTPYATVCGRCTEIINASEPVLIITASTWRKVRCRNCAGEFPPSLPPLVEREWPAPTPKALAPEATAALSFDWKARSTGEREPGQEG